MLGPAHAGCECTAQVACGCRVLEALPLRPSLRSLQPWVPASARQQRASKKRPPTTVLEPPEPAADDPAAPASNGSNAENDHGQANGRAGKEGPKASQGRGKGGARGRSRSHEVGKRKAPEAGDHFFD